MSVADHATPVLQLDDLIKHQAQKKKTGQKRSEQKTGVRVWHCRRHQGLAAMLPVPCELHCSSWLYHCTAGSVVESAVTVVLYNAFAVRGICATIVCQAKLCQAMCGAKGACRGSTAQQGSE